MGERPVSDVADALRGLRSVVNDEVDRAVELIQGEATALSAALRAGGRSQHLAHVAAEIEQVSQQLPSVLADIPAEVGTVVDTAIADLDRLLRPPGESRPRALLRSQRCPCSNGATRRKRRAPRVSTR